MQLSRAPKWRANTGGFIRCKECANCHRRTPGSLERMYRAYCQYIDVDPDNPENFTLVNQTLWLRVPQLQKIEGLFGLPISHLAEIAFSFSQSGGNTDQKETR